MKQEEGRSNKNNNNNNNNNNGNNIDESRSVSLATRHESNSAAAKTVGRRVLLLCSRFVFSFVVVVVVVVGVVVVVVVVGVVVWPAPGYRIALIFRVRTTWPFSPNRERRRTVARLSTARSGFFLSSSSHNGALVNGRLSLSLSLSASTRTCSPFIRVREVGRAAGHIIKLMRAVGSDFIHRRRRAAAETATPSKATAGATHNRFAVVVPRRFRRSDAAPVTDCCGGIRRRPRPGRERERERERERATAMTCLASRGRLRTEAASKLARADLPALDTPTHRHTHTHIYIYTAPPRVCVCVLAMCVWKEATHPGSTIQWRGNGQDRPLDTLLATAPHQRTAVRPESGLCAVRAFHRRRPTSGRTASRP